MHFVKIIIASLTLLFATVANSQTVPDTVPSAGNELVFASDTQAPMWIETLWLKSHHNRTATKNIFDNIVKREPKAVFLLGDVVNLGASKKQWKPMDAYLQRLRSKGVKVYAALGNHEVMGQAKKGQRRFQQRFPSHVKTGYVEVIDSVAVVILNSNFNSLSSAENEEQVNWYKTNLQKLDADSSIRFIISGCHHSPYTNSKIVRSSLSVREKFVPYFLKSVKSRLFLSGHSHNFEHFKMNGKDFLVIGGGGGLHQPLRQGVDLLEDKATDYKPLFHYLTIKRNLDTLQLTSLQLKGDFSGFEEKRRFEIKAVSPAE